MTTTYKRAAGEAGRPAVMTLSDKEAGMLIEAVATMKRDIEDLKADAASARSFRSKIIGLGIAAVFLQPLATGLIVWKVGH